MRPQKHQEEAEAEAEAGAGVEGGKNGSVRLGNKRVHDGMYASNRSSSSSSSASFPVFSSSWIDSWLILILILIGERPDPPLNNTRQDGMLSAKTWKYCRASFDLSSPPSLQSRVQSSHRELLQGLKELEALPIEGAR